MPFTLSHPAAALVAAPLLGRLAVPSALAIGTMAPDLPYFVAAPIPRSVTHTLSSILWFSLPLGWLGYLVFERVLRAPAVELLPAAVRQRLTRSGQLARPLAVTLSVAVGAFTHVLWDAITHSSPAAVHEIGFLADLVRAIDRLPLTTYPVMQYGSTLVGLGALVVYGLRWRHRAPLRPAQDVCEIPEPVRWRGRVALLVLPAVFGLGIAGLIGPTVSNFKTLVWLVVHAAVAGISCGVALLALASVWLRTFDGASEKRLPRVANSLTP